IRIVGALVPSACSGSAFDTKAATTFAKPSAIETADRTRHRCVFDNRRGTRLRGAHAARAEILVCSLDSNKRIASHKFAQETADYDSASRRRSPDGGTQRATRRHAAEFGEARHEIGQEYVPIHGAKCD